MLLPIVSRRLNLLGCRSLARNFSDKSKATSTPSTDASVKKDETGSEVEGHKPLYATKASYNRTIMAQRFQSDENGQRPTAMQKRFLVITRLYSKISEIPEIVANGTMNRMHDRMRVVFIITASFGFFSIFFIMEQFNARKIAKDREQGVVVTKM